MPVSKEHHSAHNVELSASRCWCRVSVFHLLSSNIILFNYIAVTDAGITAILSHCLQLQSLNVAGVKLLTSAPFRPIISGKHHQS